MLSKINWSLKSNDEATMSSTDPSSVTVAGGELLPLDCSIDSTWVSDLNAVPLKFAKSMIEVTSIVSPSDWRVPVSSPESTPIAESYVN